MIKIVELGRHITKDGYEVVYKWWKDGECACTAQRVRRTFDKKPTQKELVEAIKNN